MVDVKQCSKNDHIFLSENTKVAKSGVYWIMHYLEKTPEIIALKNSLVYYPLA